MEADVVVRDLKKTYPDGTEALKGITFHVDRKEFFAFLGPNGAGKSTTIKIVITLLGKTSGSVTVVGFDVDRQATEIRRRIGYAAQETGIDDDLTGRENLILQGRLYRLASDDLKSRVEDLLDLMDLAGDADRPAGAYSGGMRKRLDLATALIHRPQVLFLDEPTTGLDPQARSNLWKYLERLNQEEGLTIFLTTHYMEEADQLCKRLAIIDEGRIIAEGSPQSLKAGLGGDVISVGFGADVTSAAEKREIAARLLGELDFVRHLTSLDGGVDVIVENGGAAVPRILHALDGAGIMVTHVSMATPTLDDVFLKYTGRSIRQEELKSQWRSSRLLGARRRRR